MSNPVPYFLDACVPMYAVGRDHTYREPCLRILEAVALGQVAAVTSVEVIQEIAHRYDALQRRSDGLQVAERFLRTVTDVLPVTRPEAVRALELLQSYSFLLPRDAIHVAVMEAAGLTRIITADRHFDRVREVERVDPKDVTW